MERTAGVSIAAREQMTQYLERELPGFDKALGCDQGRLCLDHYHYRAMIAANPPPPTRLASPGFHSAAPCLAAPTVGVGGGFNMGPVSKKAHGAGFAAVFPTALVTVFLAVIASATFWWAAKAISDYREHQFWTEIRGTGASGPDEQTRLGSGNDTGAQPSKGLGR